MRKLRVLVLMHEDLMPPDSMDGYNDRELLEWKTEYDVSATLHNMGHEVLPCGVRDDLGVLRSAILEHQPHVVFNLLEEFHGVPHYDTHVVTYLELMKQPYTGCNPRGLLLAHDKPLCKKILTYHRIPTPRFAVFERGRAIRLSRKLNYPLMVKSATDDASLGLSQASVVSNESKLLERIAFVHEQLEGDALVEEFIEGRELYVGVLGNRRLQTFPAWELLFKNREPGQANIATRRVKWDPDYQKRHGVETQAASDLSPELRTRIERVSKRIYRVLNLSGCARMDFRMSAEGRLYCLEANPNPNLSLGEDFAESAETIGLNYERLLQRLLNLGLRYRAAWKR